jgi:hypothetical protein
MRIRVCLSLILSGVAACRDGNGWRSAFRDYARPDTVEKLHVVLDSERARGDTARKLNKELSDKNEYLLAQLNDLSRIVNEIDHDLSGNARGGEIRPLVPAGEMSNAAAERELLETKRQRIATNLSRLRSQLRTTDSLWHTAAESDSATRASLSSSAETLEMFRALAENRAIQFAQFEERIDSLEIANRALSDERDRMRDSLTRLSQRVGRVYYAVGTRDELIAAGIAREINVVRKTWRGWQREKQLVLTRESELAHLALTRTSAGAIGNGSPADEDESDVEQQGSRVPENGEFRELDRYRDTLLALPNLRRGRMRVLSSQELRYADGVGKDGRVSVGGSRIRIVDPEGFWEGGRYLVVMVER